MESDRILGGWCLIRDMEGGQNQREGKGGGGGGTGGAEGGIGGGEGGIGGEEGGIRVMVWGIIITLIFINFYFFSFKHAISRTFVCKGLN